MATTCSAYTTEDEAQAAVAELLAAGVDGGAIRVLMGEPQRDARTEAAGDFASGRVEPAEAVGRFAGETSRSAGMGGFAGGADHMRQGGFGDADRETVATYPGGVERVRVASHHNLKKMLTDAGLDEAAADADVHRLHTGRILVLVTEGAA